MPDVEVEVVVVGAGAAGLATAASLRHLGVRAVVLDGADTIGHSWSSRYERLHLHTVRRFSSLPYHPIPRTFPRYLSKDEYAQYLADYVAALDLDVALSEPARAVRFANGSWHVETAARVLTSRAVVIATGHYATPLLPEWDGRDRFQGQLLHSSTYRSGREFADLRALVVGLGNSGAEIAADLVEQGARSVSVAVRTTPPITPRELMGVLPVQLFGIALMPLGFPRIVDRVGALMRRVSVGDLRQYGLGDAAWGPFVERRPALIDVGFLRHLKDGAIAIRPAVERLTETEAVFADSSREEVDVIIAAIGFRTGLERLLFVPDVLDDRGEPLFRSAEPTTARGLWFIGFDETVRGHLYEASRESRKLATKLKRSLLR